MASKNKKGLNFFSPFLLLADALTWRRKLRVQLALRVWQQQPSQPSSHASWCASSWAWRQHLRVLQRRLQEQRPWRVQQVLVQTRQQQP